MLDKSFKVVNPTGFDAKVCSLLVNQASRFESTIKLQLNDLTVNFKSIMGVMSLNIRKGEQVKVICSGADEEIAIGELVLFITQNKIGKEL